MNLKKILLLARDDTFESKLKQEIAAFDAGLLPLQQGLSLSSYVGSAPFKPVILSYRENNDHLVIKAGIFYTGIIAGCSCADDPSPTDEQNEYCELEFMVQKDNGDVTVELLEQA